MEKPSITGWEITINEKGVEMATLPAQLLRDTLACLERLEKQCDIANVVQAKPEKVCEAIRQKLDDWVFGLETQSGEKLKVVDSTDFNEIITEIENELKNL